MCGVVYREYDLLGRVEVRTMDDQALLARYVADRDANAFEELTRRYAGLVKRVCIRVLGNAHDAEEVSQECFFELARHAGDVHTSLGGWLHRTATSRSLNALRSKARRKVREREVSLDAEKEVPAFDMGQADLRRLIDRALTELPDELHLPMMLHFFGGRSQRDVAIQLGLNQSTISRRMQDALQFLRERLTKAGYAATAPAVMVLMQDRAAAAAEYGLPLVDASNTAGHIVISTTLASAFKGAFAVLLPVLGYLLFGGWISLLVALGITVTVARKRPIWFSELMSTPGSDDIYRRPTFMLRQWDWVSPPNDWRLEVRGSFAWSVLFLVLAIVFATGTPQVPWGTVMSGLAIAIGYLAHAIRLIRRVNLVSPSLPAAGVPEYPCKQIPDRSIENRNAGMSASDPSTTWFDVTQRILTGFMGTWIAASSVVRPRTEIVWPAVLLSGSVGAWMFFAGVRLVRRMANRSQSGNHFGRSATAIEGRFDGIRTFLAAGTTVVVCLSGWILWNPSSARGDALSLAAVQTSILGWMLYRVAAQTRTSLSHPMRRIVFAVLTGCFVLNSGVCFANWMR